MANGRKNKGKKTPVRFPIPPPIADDDNDDLMNQLLEQMGSQDGNVQARKAAALAESFSPDDPLVQERLRKETEAEEEAISQTCQELNLRDSPDGHCLFSALGDQLVLLGVLPPEESSYEYIRAAAAKYIYTHPDDFLPFLPFVRR
ncbi:hypothetical protein DFP72DRAFT_1058966 [Ephemerocybe angulata]|uniref:OTU domain-containing protein n=1 Tax=Ephemerocybe angulata TaxID=980116 RepID=A0A8H6IGE5_9AGAR|nr:hypothetical protein DFP72DRAFT_1058966 [Tulosesus angulatus]